MSLPVKHLELSKPLDVGAGLGTSHQSRATPVSCSRRRGGSGYKLPLVNSAFQGFTSQMKEQNLWSVPEETEIFMSLTYETWSWGPRSMLCGGKNCKK